MTKKTQEKYDAILTKMKPDVWYKTQEIELFADVKTSRVKILLKDLLEMQLIESSGSTKGRLYRKILK